MKLGIFDSGLGGVLIAKSIRAHFPDLDIMYLGDTQNLPYGARSEAVIYEATKNCINAMFRHGCTLIIVACNTVSASALRRIQQEYLPNNYPDRRVLGVVVPTIEEAIDRNYKKLAVIATNYTIASNVYPLELQKINPQLDITTHAAPLLVPLIENGGEQWLDAVLDHYLEFTKGADFDALLLGCTHYIHLKQSLRARYNFDIISQDEIIPTKLAQYFARHPKLKNSVECNGMHALFVTDYTNAYEKSAQRLFGQDIHVKHIKGVHNNDS